MSFSSTPYHARHHHALDEARDYRVQYPHHARHHHHHDADEPRAYPVQRSDKELTSYENYPCTNRPHTYNGRYGDTDPALYENYPYTNRPHTYVDQYGDTVTEPRRVHAAEYEVYEYAPAPPAKVDGGSRLVDEDINEEADQFIRMEHKRFGISKWTSGKSG